MYDFDCFHGGPNSPVSRFFLYLDGHVEIEWFFFLLCTFVNSGPCGRPIMWKRVVAISVAIVLLFGGTAWAWRHFRYNYHLKKIQALQAEFGSDMTEEQRRELREKMRAEMDQLSPEQRREAMRPMFHAGRRMSKNTWMTILQ